MKDKWVTARKILSENYYNKALTYKWVEKPMSWALYQTWKEFDSKEKPRKRVDNDTQRSN